MKTKVKIIKDSNIGENNVGKVGYIDGYTQDQGPTKACVVVGKKIFSVYLDQLQVLDNPTFDDFK